MKNIELWIYDKGLNLLGIVDEIASLLWTPTYWSEGGTNDVKLLVPMTENNKNLLVKGNIIVKHDGTVDHADEAGNWRRGAQIKYRRIKKDTEGAEQIEVQGHFLKKWLGKRIILNKIVMTGTEQAKINRIVNENHGNSAIEKRRLPYFVMLAQEDLGGQLTEYANEDYINAGKEIYNRALAGKLGYDIFINENEKKYGFYLYKGRDLTSTNTEGNTPSVFSRDFDNVSEQEYTESDEGVKNVMYVTGEADEAGNTTLVEVDQGGTGIDRDEVYIDMASIKRKYTENEVEITIAEEEYNKMLATAASAELEDYKETVTFNAAIKLDGNLKYREDFNVGDKVTCIERSWGIRVDVRITAICESYQGGIKEIEATLGESLPTLLKQIRKVR